MNDLNILETYQFFQSTVSNDFRGRLVIWTKQDKATKQFAADQLEQAAKYCIKRSKSMDVYFGLGLVHENVTGGRGKAEDVIALPGVWLDVDIVSSLAHKSNKYPTSVKEAWEIIKKFPLSPTTVVHSGYGLHCYWLFPELLKIESDEERHYAQHLSRTFQHHMMIVFQKEGYKLDNTSDLARVLRVPGTLNHKQDKLKPVKIILPKRKVGDLND